MTSKDEASTLETAQAKRLTAVTKLQQARSLIEAAAEDLAMLEGPGYCENYEAVQKAQYDLGKLTDKISTLVLPTGTFQI